MYAKHKHNDSKITNSSSKRLYCHKTRCTTIINCDFDFKSFKKDFAQHFASALGYYTHDVPVKLDSDRYCHLTER